MSRLDFGILKPSTDRGIVADTSREPSFQPREETFGEMLNRSVLDEEGFVAATQDTLISNALRLADVTGFPATPGYEVDVERWKTDAQLIDPDLRLGLLGARSSAEYFARLADARITTESRRTLASKGVGGIVANVAAQVLDPASIATLGVGTVGAGVRGVAAGVTAASAIQNFANAALSDNITAIDALGSFAGDAAFFGVMGKFARATRGQKALIGGVAQGLPNTLATAVQEDATVGSIGASMGISFMLGGVFGAATPAPRTPAALAHDKAAVQVGQKWNNIAEMRRITGKAPTLSPEAMDFVPARILHLDDDVIASMKSGTTVPPPDDGASPVVDPGFLQTFRPGGTNPTTDAPLANPFRRQDYKAGDIDLSRIDTTARGQRTLRIGSFDTKIPFSLNPVNWITDGGDALARAYGNLVGTALNPRKDGSVGYAAIARRDDYHRSRALKMEQTFNSRFDAMNKRLEGENQPKIDYDAFDHQVTQAVRRLNDDQALRTFAPEVIEQAREVSRMMTEDVVFALRHRGEPVPNDLDPSYMPNMWSRAELDRLKKEVGTQNAEDFLANAIVTELDAKVASGGLFSELEAQDLADKNAKLAKNMARRLLKNGGRKGKAERITGLTEDELEEELRATFGEIEADDLSHLKAVLVQKTEDQNPRFRPRIPINALYQQEIDGRLYRIEDFLDNSAKRLYGTYAYGMASDAALHEVRRVFKLKTGQDLPDTHAKMQAWAQDRYGDATIRANGLVYLDRLLRGMSNDTSADSTFNRFGASASRIIRDGVYGSVMGDPRTAVVQSVEAATLFANDEVSLAFINRAFPGLSDVYTAFKNGEMPKHELLSHIMEARGLGLASAQRNVGAAIDPSDAVMAKMGKAEAIAAGYRHAMGKYVALDVPLSDLTAALGEFGVIGRFIMDAENSVRRVVDVDGVRTVVYSGDQSHRLSAERLRALGLDEEMNERIKVQIRRHGQKNEGGEIVHPRDTEWDDLDAAIAFRDAVSIGTRRITNYGDSSSIASFANTWWGKVFTQLQRWGINSHGNMTQAQLQFADAGAVRVMAAQSAAGMLTLAVGALLAAPAQKDPDEYLRRRLNAKNVASAAFGRAAWTGMLPRATDVAAASLGYDPLFAQTRSAAVSRDGGALGLAFNFPALDTITSLVGTPGAVRSFITGDGNERAFDTIWKGAMLPTTLQMHRAIRNYLDLPERPAVE